jgi:uncharacterized membrane protein YphA (DoxX/SURF4 family)
MSSSRARALSSWILVVLLAVLYASAALWKVSGGQAEIFTAWGYPAWFALVIGVLELAGAVGLLIPRTTHWAVFGLTGIMLGAVYTHLANGEGFQVLRPLVFLAMLWVAWLLRRGNR